MVEEWMLELNKDDGVESCGSQWVFTTMKVGDSSLGCPTLYSVYKPMTPFVFHPSRTRDTVLSSVSDSGTFYSVLP